MTKKMMKMTIKIRKIKKSEGKTTMKSSKDLNIIHI